ncbi:MAG: recombinase family protein [Clostridia bacterium]|nr:recombinase family protein [Clostridia bacterium]
MASVRVIPATKAIHTGASLERKEKRRVAGYARVSTDKEEQVTSYEAQVDYYTKYIGKNPDWELVEVYTDEGISATNTKKRDGFNRMIADALAGRIDLIVTKSVSRFARNTVDSLSAIRNLKDHGTEVYFEKEGIWTFDSKGELLITIMSSLAQEESRSISDNVTWGQRKRFADGKVNMPFSSFLGYRKGENGVPEIDPEEAETVRIIYRLFMEGMTVSAIAKRLTEAGTPTPMGKAKWSERTLTSILTNERYKGDALLQKHYTVDFLTKKQKKNEGEVQQYYVEGSHPAIIDRAEWDLVQAEMAKRREKGRWRNSLSPFALKICCGECGGWYGSKVWHSTDKYRKVVWRCNGKYERHTCCSTPTINDSDIAGLFLRAASRLRDMREILIGDCEALKEELSYTADIEKQINAVEEERFEVEALVAKLIQENATVKMDQTVYNSRLENYNQRYDALGEKLGKLRQKQERLGYQASLIGRFVSDLAMLEELPVDFSPELWNALVEKVTIQPDGTADFLFKNGVTITEPIKRD